MRHWAWSALALAGLAAGPALGDPGFDSPWVASPKSRARLVADGLSAGFEIALAPGAITYWRDPGEAGVPPSFDFSQSENLASAKVDFPAPARIPEPDGSVAFGYRGSVILPILATALDPAKPVKLVAKVEYAVCEKVCLPARAQGQVTLSHDAGSPHAAALAAAKADIPAPATASALGVEISGAGAGLWRLCLNAAPRDLFVEPPEGYWLESKPDPDGRCRTLTLRQSPEGAKTPIPVRLTTETGAGAFETALTLQN